MASAQLALYSIGAFITALTLSLLGTYLVRGWAARRGYVDVPNDSRRIHTDPTPNVGGVAIAFATITSFIAWGLIANAPSVFLRPEIVATLLGAVLIFAVGFRDDTRPMRAVAKFGLQWIIAALVFVSGVRIGGIEFGSVWSTQLTTAASFVLTTVWIVGTTNAFNLIDGSDGVAGGAAMFASVSMAIIFALLGDPLGALMATILVGACIGFLFFNFPPASVFMGDCGSLFLGYTLATLGVLTTQTSSTLLAIAIPMIAFAVPLLDTSIAIVRRFLRHQPIFTADRGHIHHRLSDLGLSSRGVAVLLYVACAGCASLSLLLAAPGRTTALPVFVVAGTVLVLAVQRLNVPELTELTRVVGRGLQQRQVISHNVRMHTAAQALDRARSGAEVAEALESSFGSSEFARVELRVEGVLARGVFASDALSTVAAGDRETVIVFTFEHLVPPEQELEMRIPLWDGGRCVGHLCLFRTAGGDRLYTDLRLVAKYVAPALVRTLRRLSPRRAEGGAELA